MALSKESKSIIRYTDLFIGDFWRYLLKSGWLFFPSILFLLIAYAGFWHVVQGKDLMVITLEKIEKESGFAVLASFILGLFFWIYVTWFSTRLVTKAKILQTRDTHYMWKIFREQSPRILGFTCITIILLAFFQLGNPNYLTFSSGFCHILLLLSFGWYFTVYRFWRYILSRKKANNIEWLKYLRRIRAATFIVLGVWVSAVILIKSFGSLISLLIGWQVGLVLLLMVRREMIETKKKIDNIKTEPVVIRPPFRFWKKLWHIASDKEERTYFRMFSIISFAAFIIYLGAVYEIRWAVFIGSFPFTLLAFGVLLGIGNLITFVSVTARFNFHVIFFIWAFILGNWKESHYATIHDKQDQTALFSNRKHLRDHFKDWIEHPDRKANIDSANKENPYRMYFVLANGGASRSGYWTASILSTLEDTTNGKFSKHLFCLSGASGGSVGTATFFNLLRSGKNPDSLSGNERSFAEMSKTYLASDFLTYTLSHLLCSDIFRNVAPAKNTKDRSAALAYSLERASGKNSFLYDSMASRFSTFITQKGKQYDLPLLCINATQVQTGLPALISNFSVEKEKQFNGRVDVLSLLSEDDDMKLSTAVVLGASFPYISPAGRIDKKTTDSTRKTVDSAYYFVDGAYFDNSGAGVVNEILIYLDHLLKNDPEFEQYRNKFEFNIIHISNTDPKKINTGQINPLVNDLFAPVQTIMGSYGTQTTVNDERLKNFLFSLHNNKKEVYTNIDLYHNAHYIKTNSRDSAQIRFSMNWVISDYQRSHMDKCLRENEDFKTLCDKMIRILH